jgi:hypothetical protein
MAKRLRDVCGLLKSDPARTCPQCGAPVIVALTVQEILDEHIAKKLA